MDVPAPVPSPSEVNRAFHEELHPGRQSAVISWMAFTGTFALVRFITHRIRAQKGSLHNLSVGGRHLHHYLWGILTLTVVGGVAVRGSEEMRRHPLTATAYGSGLALIVDEFALLLDLQDVYWAKDGRDSVDLAIGLIATSGTVLAGFPVLRRLRRNRRR